MATMRVLNVLLSVTVAFCCCVALVGAQPYTVSNWSSGGHATFYGGEDASGTMNGACGYGNLYSQGYGTNTAALSHALFNNGLSCGACFALQCIADETSWCYNGDNVLYVTATNYCPQGSFGGWCDYPKEHFDLAYPAFTQLAQATGGVIPVQYRRVPCFKNGGIRFSVSGSQWYLSVLVTNVGGAGDVQALSVKGSDTGFVSLDHNWGQVWTQETQFSGQDLTFKVTVGDGSFQKTSTFWSVAPSNWELGQTFEAPYNFNW